MYTIQNEELQVKIKGQGAELAGIRSLARNLEYMWHADPAFWGRHSSLLFPIIGTLSNNEYSFNKRKYSLKRHGFARNTLFSVVHRMDDKICFSISNNQDTLSNYPFQFELQAEYILNGSTLSIIYRVFNRDNQSIYFSVGGHPAFNCPLKEGEVRSDYSLVFDQVETATSEILNDAGLRTGAEKVILNNSATLPITDDLFDQDALILKGLQSSQVSLVDPQGIKVWTFDFTGFSHLGIWSPSAAAPFVCIEPWNGVADPIDPPASFEQKEGVVALPVGAVFECVHRVEVH